MVSWTARDVPERSVDCWVAAVAYCQAPWGHGVLLSLAAPRPTALAEDNNTVTLLDLSLYVGYMLKRTQCYCTKTNIIVQMLCFCDLVFGDDCCVWLPPAVFRADVSSLFMSFAWWGMHFCLRLVWSTKAERQLSSSLINSCKATHAHGGHSSQLSLYYEPQLVLTPYRLGVPTLMFMNWLH